MKISRKCQYALRAIIELAVRDNSKPVKTRTIAAAQRISPRFLELILNELKHGGFVESRRGSSGGYLLTADPEKLTVGEVMEFVEGPDSLKIEVGTAKKRSGGLFGDEALKELWNDISSALLKACNDKTFAELICIEREKKQNAMSNYCI